MELARIRTLKEAFAEIKTFDPKTAISFSYLRRLVLSGAIPSIRAGNKFLLNMAHLEEYLNNPRRLELDRIREYETARNNIRMVRV